MLLYVVNKYHKQINYPLQVVSLFFAVYSKLDWETQGVSIDGIVSVEDERIVYSESNNGDLLFPPSLMDKYRTRYNQSRIGGRKSSNSRSFSVNSIEGGGGGDRGGGGGGNISGGNIKIDSKLRASMFVVNAMNIVNPLDVGENLMENDKFSEKKAVKIQQVISVGAKNLQPILSHLEKENENNVNNKGVKQSFRYVWNRGGERSYEHCDEHSDNTAVTSAASCTWRLLTQFLSQHECRVVR